MQHSPPRVADQSALPPGQRGRPVHLRLGTDRRIYCWGGDFEGQLGDGNQELRLTPVPVATTRRVKAVRAGYNHTCGITEADAAFCWGASGFGALGDGTTEPGLTPVLVKGGHRWRDLDAGAAHTCGATAGNVAYCWVHNGLGKLGDGTTTTRRVPRRVAGGLAFWQVSAGFNHSCGVTSGESRLLLGRQPARRWHGGGPSHTDPGVR